MPDAHAGTDRPAPGQLLSLQMLRAVAALLVVMFHTAEIVGTRTGQDIFGKAFFEGRHGVDLFFVLSGFVITHVHRRDWGSPRRLGNYLFNRISRIYPSVWVMTGLALAIYATGAVLGVAVGVAGTEPSSKLGAWGVAASALLLPQQGVPLVNVTWTLKCEVFFYLAFALLILDRRWLALLAAWQAAVLGCVLAGVDFDASWARFYVGPLVLEFGLGMACAWLLPRLAPPSAPPRAMPAAVALVLGVVLYAGGALADTYWHDRVAPPDLLVYGIGSTLIVASLALLEAAGRLPASRLLVYLGDASYAIYLVHFSVITLISGVLARAGLLATGTVACLGLALAGVLAGMAFHHGIDRPIQRALRRWKPTLIGQGPRRSSATHSTALP